MFVFAPLNYSEKAVFYAELGRELEPLLIDAWYANLANASALLMAHLPRLNWAGFYLAKSPNELVLGPFQGLPACLKIPFGKGVCGAAAESGKSQVVGDVHAFPGHIACDARSRSEIVLPLFAQSRLVGVLDLDSPELNRFDEADRGGLETFAKILSAGTPWPREF